MTGSGLLELNGICPSGATRLLGDVGNIARCRCRPKLTTAGLGWAGLGAATKPFSTGRDAPCAGPPERSGQVIETD